MKLRLRLIAPVVAGLTLIASARANGTRLPSQDAWVVARGNAAVAGVTNPSAIYYNPAGLSAIQRSEISQGVYLFVPDTEFTSATTGRTVEEQSDVFFQPHFFAALPLRGDVTVGAGVFSPFGQSTEWPANSGFAGLATFSEVIYVSGAIAASWRVSPSLALGAGLHFSHARVDLNRMTAIAPGVVRSFGFKGRDNAFSGNVGLQWRPLPVHTFGLHYQRKTSFTFDGTAAVTGVLAQSGRLDWTFPDNIAAGWQWTFAPTWQMEISYDWTNWERVNTLQLQAGPLSTAVALNWEASAYTCIGVSHDVDANWSWAAGYHFSENSVPTSTLAPSLPDVDRHLLSGGVFWKGDRWQFHAALQHGLPSRRTKAAPAPDGLGGSGAGTYRNQFWAADLQAVFRF